MTSAEAWFSNSLRPRKPEGSLGRTAQEGYLDSHTAPELCRGRWEGGRLYTYRYTVYHQNDACIKMGVDESHFNVSLIMRDKVTRQCPQTTTFEENGEPKRYRTEVLLLTSLPPYH